jgi:hypothetical protein
MRVVGSACAFPVGRSSSIDLPLCIVLYVIPTETLIKRQVTRHDCHASPACWAMGTNDSETVYCEKKNICTGPTKAPKAEQKSLVLSRRSQPTNQSCHVYSSDQVELYNYFYFAGSGSPSRAG